MVSLVGNTVLVGLVGMERVAELIVSRRNAAWSRSRGAIEVGQGHYPFMVFLHTCLLLGTLLEPWLAERPFDPAMGATMLLLVCASQGLRWWCIRSLGSQWNTRVLLIPGASRVRSGPYRWLTHPNYVAVVLEGMALPLFHGAWWTALGFTALNLPLMVMRIQCEDAALRTHFIPPVES